MTLQDDIQKALLTWYPEGHKLHCDLDHPTMKLAGEAGEILDLYAKHKYKPGFDWWQCKKCSKPGIDHGYSHDCVSLVLDELGDWWYYWRILAYIHGIDDYPYSESRVSDIGHLLSSLNHSSSCIRTSLLFLFDPEGVLKDELRSAYVIFCDVVLSISASRDGENVTIEQITQLNYQKLHGEKTHHGWKGA